MRELRGAVASGAMDKQKLVSQFDVMRVEMLTKGRQQIGDKNFALIATGGWSRAANLAATAAKDDPAALSDLSVLKVRSVVEALIQLLGSDADVQPVVANLQKVLPITDDARPTPPTAQDVDVLIEVDRPPFALADPEPTDEERAIARSACGFIPSGATLQTGIGGIPGDVARILAEGDGGDGKGPDP